MLARKVLQARLEALREAWEAADLAEQGRDVEPHLSNLVYRGPADFVLRHGRWFPLQPLPEGIPDGPANHCYGTAIFLAASRRLRYVEGYALMPHVVATREEGQHLEVLVLPDPERALCMQHAWNTDETGRLIDSTWSNGGFAYCGVEFSVERADDCTWNGDATVLNDCHRGYPLLGQEWRGEPPDLQWPPSPLLELMRNPPASMEERVRALRDVTGQVFEWPPQKIPVL